MLALRLHRYFYSRSSACDGSAETPCSLICDLGLSRVVPLLSVDAIGVQCNTLALLGALCAFRECTGSAGWLLSRSAFRCCLAAGLADLVVLHGAVPAACALRSTKHDDIRNNARFLLSRLGFSDVDPTPAYSKRCAMPCSR